MRISLAALAATFVVAACVDQTPFTPNANTVVVHAVLDVGTRNQYVVVQSTSGALRDQREVLGAAVSISTPDGRQLIADEVKDSAFFGTGGGAPLTTTVYRISLDRYGVSLVAGGTYSLRVVLPDGRTVTGTTTIPPVAPGFAHKIDTLDGVNGSLSLSWPRTPGVKAYELSVSPSPAKQGLFVDTSIVLTSQSQVDGWRLFTSASTTLAITAVDENYYDYLRRASDPWTSSGLITHLDGAVGVFGSIVPVLRRTVVLR